MKRLDMDNWERQELYGFFSNISNPFYSITFTQDVTKLREYTKKNGLSFYLSLIWLCTRAINEIPEFLVGIEDAELVSYERRDPSFTDLKPGSRCFHIVTMPAGAELRQFCRLAREKSGNQTGFIDASSETGSLIYFSCVPWLEITGLTNERDFDANDSVPRIAWGKYARREGKLVLGISIEVNHKFVDGLHIGLFHEKLTELIDNLE